LISLSERKNVVFITGGVFGVDKSIWQRANNVLALSRLTFTHRLVRLILCEQIYRALTIINNRNYHK